MRAGRVADLSATLMVCNKDTKWAIVGFFICERFPEMVQIPDGGLVFLDVLQEKRFEEMPRDQEAI